MEVPKREKILVKALKQICSLHVKQGYVTEADFQNIARLALKKFAGQKAQDEGDKS